ncbi:MAG: hypothetical protein KME18_28280 [Phormidium tanganyikae FI6-MK23]|nr:hypothetical protein [Phormidium tanganyikae FI6-MK23]
MSIAIPAYAVGTALQSHATILNQQLLSQKPQTVEVTIVSLAIENSN